VALGVWARQDGTGIAFDSSTGFTLSNGAVRSPDASWIRRARLEQLTTRQKAKFWAVCPDFVIELRSSSDSLQKLQNKMKEYLKNGAQLGWLIDPEERQVFVYRLGHPAEHLKNPTTISGDPILPGFILDLKEIWEPDF
ncbi:MAG TPA: Uma2 family endonuclease, partial [Anaerolineales bacterium]|nr:Uma2 family endonuclease [Anaerolineales bacterium]